MVDGEDWVMRPVVHGMVSYEALKDGRIDLLDLLRMNEALTVRAHNEQIVRAAARDRSRKRG